MTQYYKIKYVKLNIQHFKINRCTTLYGTFLYQTVIITTCNTIILKDFMDMILFRFLMLEYFFVGMYNL